MAGLIAVALAMAIPAAPAAAESLIDLMISGFRVPPPPPPPGELLRSLFNGNARSDNARGSGGPYAAFCVRLCDGRYFPIQVNRNMPAAEQCNTFCPATATKIFSGSSIEHAVAGNGRRYADLPNAFVYRARLVPGCTCNGTSTVGMAQVPVADDPTLRAGDIVATNSGLTVYNGRNPQQAAAYTPIDEARVSKSLRNRLADVKVAPRTPAVEELPPEALPDTTASIGSGTRRLSERAR